MSINEIICLLLNFVELCCDWMLGLVNTPLPSGLSLSMVGVLCYGSEVRSLTSPHTWPYDYAHEA